MNSNTAVRTSNHA